MPMVTVSISPEQAAKMREAVDSGDYASGSEVVRAALRLWLETEARNGASPRKRPSNDEHLNVAELYAAHSTKRRHA
ncbi:antitoxin ParD1/3/4 [Rhizobium skierniewicense]|uniref:Antitoxin ParD1/3/4 n=1 Tax=Rhizobium skierniewicense TaxID=984260 RepID=A0A7W6C3H4_9HYPH|nr:type II toxin-antitoxin system ParD family antitoxin [Rhizobium skierniewicense]MBB3945072.1 antitoxin ParD1/3/4 [Rhizobium skierniewicense]NTF31131.1 type II toxin-antitoxin system ParD family antitoxin [Rhizobium skierniewicense]